MTLTVFRCKKYILDIHYKPPSLWKLRIGYLEINFSRNPKNRLDELYEALIAPF
jgi:hypothetical protein